VTRTSRFDFGSGPDPDPAYQWDIKLFILAEVCTLPSDVLGLWTEGRKDGRTDGRKDGRTEGRKDGHQPPFLYPPSTSWRGIKI